MDDLVKRLRGYGSNRCWPHGPACDCTQAAARIEALEARVAAADKLAEALSNAAARLDDYSPSTRNTIETVSSATARKALAAYQATKEQSK